MKILLFIFLMGCAHTKIEKASEPFDLDTFYDLTPQERKMYASLVIQKEQRDPQGFELKQFERSSYAKVKKSAIVIFETEIAPSRSGLASNDNIYFSPRGKQLLTLELYQEFKKNFQGPILWSDIDEIKKASAFRSYGFIEEDHILSFEKSLTSLDIFWRVAGSEISNQTLFSPPSFQDLSLLYVPASHFFISTKMIEHQKHWVNDLCRELKLDAVVVVFLQSEWIRGGIDKRTKHETQPQLSIQLSSAIVYPFKTYQAYGESIGVKDLPKMSLPLATYELKSLSALIYPEEKNFKSAMETMINPFQQKARAMLSLMALKIESDLLNVGE